LRPVSPASPTDHELPGRVDEEALEKLGVLIQPRGLGAEHGDHHVLPEVGLDRRLGVDADRVLGRDQELLDPDRPPVRVADRDLGLAVGTEVVEGPVLADRGEPFRQPVRDVDRHRHQRLRLVGRVAEHHPLIPGPGDEELVARALDSGLVGLVDPLGDVGRLLVDRNQDRDVVAVVAVVAVVVADLADRLADQLGHV
jgi:hypothetical protein